MYWNKIENHSDLVYQEKSNQEIVSSVDPLFEDEAKIQMVKYGKRDYRFNNGHNKISFSTFIAVIEKVYVEPVFFIALKKFNTIIKESVGYDWFNTSLKRFLYHLFFFKYKNIDEAVLFNSKSGLNVFHFYNDVLPKIWDAKKEHGDKPFLISEELYVSILFQYFLSYEFVKRIRWHVVKKDTYYFVNKLILIKAEEYNSEHLKFIADKILEQNSFEQGQKLKIFINRKESSGRTISNFKDLEKTLIENNFLILYLEEMSISKQIEFFSNADFIIGIHGAGLANIIFSHKNNPEIIEIAPSDFTPTHYYWLSQSLGFNYHLFLGDEILRTEAANTFSIDVKRFGHILSTFKKKSTLKCE